MPWFSPLLLAKQAATLDTVSAGRLDLGLGLGWAAEEYRATGAPSDRRGARAEEFVACLTACFADGVVDFPGEFHEVGPAPVDPKPVQSPRPPVLLGGGAERRPAPGRAGRRRVDQQQRPGPRVDRAAIRVVRMPRGGRPGPGDPAHRYPRGGPAPAGGCHVSGAR